MKAKMVHECIHVLDLEKSLEFYEKALGLVEQSSMGPEDGSWKNVYIGNGETDFQMELTWNNGRTEPYKTTAAATRISHSRWTTWMPLAPCTKKWDASAS